MKTLAGLGAIPAAWDTVPARRLLTLRKEAAQEDDSIVTAFRDGSVTLRSKRRTDGYTEALKEIGYQHVRPGDLVVHSMDGFAGAIGVSDSRGKMSPVANIYSVKGDARFFAYTLRILAWAGYVTALAKGIRERSTSFDAPTIGSLVLPNPHLNEQRRIADFLDDRVARIDEIVAARNAQLLLLEELLLEQMRSAVAGTLESQAGVQTEQLPWIARVSPDALVVPLARVVTLQRGVDLTEEQRQPGVVKVVTTAGVVGVHATAIEQGPGVVIGRYGSVGNVHWVDGPYWPHNTTLYVKDARGNDLRWLYYLLRTFPYGAMQARAAIPGVNRNDLATELVPWIPQTQQKASVTWIDRRMHAHERHRSALSQSVERLLELKASLITAAVTGEIDVTTSGSGIPS